MERIHLWVSGIVQGVAFRYYTTQKATDLGLMGWVKNLPDGRVEIVVEGPKEKLETFEVWARQGPPSAMVSRVKRREESPTGASEGFRIIY